jgi:hypothetical protein
LVSGYYVPTVNTAALKLETKHMSEERLEQGACCLCGSTIGGMGYGHNPAPVMTEGRCCGMCNGLVVIPARIQAMIKDETKVKEIKNA